MYRNVPDWLDMVRLAVCCASRSNTQARHLWNTPSNAPQLVVPEMDNREAELAAQVDRYGSKYGKSTRYRSVRQELEGEV